MHQDNIRGINVFIIRLNELYLYKIDYMTQIGNYNYQR